MALVESVPGKGNEDFEDAVGVRGGEPLFNRAVAEVHLLLFHDFLFFLSHGSAQEVRLSETVPRDTLGNLHNLFLVDDNPVGFFKNVFEAGIGVLYLGRIEFRFDEIVDIGHGSGTVQRVQRDEVFYLVRFGPFENVLHSLAFKLEYRRALSLPEHAEGERIGFIDAFNGKIGKLAAPFADKVFGPAYEGEGLEPEKVHLYKSALFNEVHRKLGGYLAGFGILVKGNIVRELCLADNDSRGMKACVAICPFKCGCDFKQLVETGIVFQGSELTGTLNLRVRLECVLHLCFGIARNEFGNAVYVGQGYIQNAGNVFNGGLGFERSEGYDVVDTVIAVFFAHVFDNFLTTFLTEVDIEVRHGDAFRIQESFKEQTVAQRFNVGNTQCIRDNRARSGTAAGSNGNVTLFRPGDKVPHDEKVSHEVHLYDDVELIFRAFEQVVGYIGIAVLEPCHDKVAEVVFFGREFRRNRVLGKKRSRLGNFKIAGFRDTDGVGNHLGILGEKRGHFIGGLEIKFRSLEPHTVGVVTGFLGSYAQEDILGNMVPFFRIVRVVGNNHGNAEPSRECNEQGRDFLLFLDTVVLEFNIVVVAKPCPVPSGGLFRFGDLSREKKHGQFTGETGRKTDDALVVACKQFFVDPGLVVHALGKREGRQDFEILVSLRVFGDEYQMVILDSGCRFRPFTAIAGRDIEFAADKGFYARFYAFLIKPEYAEHVSVVGYGQCLVTKFHGAGDHFLVRRGTVKQ